MPASDLPEHPDAAAIVAELRRTVSALEKAERAAAEWRERRLDLWAEAYALNSTMPEGYRPLSNTRLGELCGVTGVTVTQALRKAGRRGD